ncbi:MAG: metalloregulator ArsR/SmtB family transcription factor [Proteobacteria bacterium]|nr:metalloregulator ArsR/SmtB family transcription factor [Pseudomonadota bacterium]MCP4920015.1 metalloregulator ArsR/SmtB family transcription factor [Pseudomonadota bacterium]
MRVFDVLSALSEPVRVRLLALLEVEELGVKELQETLSLPQSTISRHLKVLHERGLVQKRSAGTSSLFRVTQWDASTSALWASVRGSVEELRAADLARMQTVLALRRADGEDFFTRHASQWDALREDLFGRDFLVPTLLSLLPDGLVIADLGCGTGEMLARLAPVSDRVIGVDREPAMLEQARRRGEFDLRVGELHDLPLEDEELDLALLVLVLHHVAELEPVFAELARVLKPGGRAVILEMVEHSRSEFRRTMGHKHLGFAVESLSAPGLSLSRHQLLSRSDEALGPGLQLVVLQRDPNRSPS